MKKASKIIASLFSAVFAASLAFTPAGLAFATSAAPEGDVSLPDTSGAPSTDAPVIEQVDDEWVVTFNGTDMDSTLYEMVQQVAGLQPGDQKIFKIKLVNDCDKDVDWYVKNYIADSMEDDSTNALGASITGASYSYELLYYDEYQDGAEVDTTLGTAIYGNENLGGEGATEDRAQAQPDGSQGAEPNSQSVSAAPGIGTGKNEAQTGGLQNATNSNAKDSYFYLGRFAPDTVRMMTLSLGLDGETHTNAYFNTNAGVVIGYAAEPVGEGEEIVTTERTTTYEQAPRTVGGDLPQTGDMLPTISMICLVLGLIVLVCGIASWMNDRRHAKEGE